VTKVDCLIPSYRTFNSNAYHALVAMMNHSRDEGLDVHVPGLFSAGVIHWHRNTALTKVRKSADYIALIDDDMLPAPDSLVRLVRREVPVISALTTTRQLPVKLNVKAYDEEKDAIFLIEAVRPDTLISGKFGVGAGFLLIHTWVLEKVLGQYLSARDWEMDNFSMLERLGVSPELRWKERDRIAATRQRNHRDGIQDLLFHYHLIHDLQIETGEDISFCRRILQLGIPVAVDTGVQVGHLADHPFGPWDLEDKPAIAGARAGAGQDICIGVQDPVPA
jgi:glycosyltransferase involved in cell wall biosynthesis